MNELNIDKTNTMHFQLNFSSNRMLQISYCETNEKKAVHMKFLGLDLDNNMIWKTGMNKIITKLSTAFYVIRSVYFLNDVSTFKTIMHSFTQ
jgi:hypothetical protein